VKVSNGARLSVRDLISDRHLVIGVKVLEEALAGMRPQQNCMRIADVKETEDGQQKGEDDRHHGVSWVVERWRAGIVFECVVVL
jgi:hypothetical protein